MTPAQFLSRMKKRDFAPAYLFLGVEAYQRRQCREALLTAALGDEGRDNGLTRYDLTQSELAEVLDDARSLSLFAADRVILATGAEGVLPKGRGVAADESDDEGPAGGSQPGLLAEYMKDPSPGVTLVFDCERFDLEGEDKTKTDRVRKFFSAIHDVVEMRRYDMEDAAAEAQKLVQRAGLQIENEALALLLESLAGDVARIAVEIEKLALYSPNRPIHADDIAVLVPDARATTIFALVGALGRRDRTRSLQVLDTLAKEGEYLPLALSFLSTQFRLALAAKEAGLRSPQQIQQHFSRSGIQVWGGRAEQVYQTMSKFSKSQLVRGITLVYEADKGMRNPRPDDRIVMERFVLELTGN
jgi:DNA polymerase-3 subunit delta